jgi:hypothetical protein
LRILCRLAIPKETGANGGNGSSGRQMAGKRQEKLGPRT